MSRLVLNKLPLWKGQTLHGVRNAPHILEKIIRENRGYKQEIRIGGVPDSVINNSNTNVQKSIYYFPISEIKDSNDLLINLGGDHSIAIGTIPLSVLMYPKIKVVWLDAHADIHSPDTSLTGNYHGMPVWFVSELSTPSNFSNNEPLQNKLSLDNLYYYGIRDVEEAEQKIIEDNNIKHFTSEEIISQDRTDDIIEWLADSPIHLSFDVDALDPEIFPSTGVTASRGLSLDNVKLLCEKIKCTGNLKAIDIVEFNPEIGSGSDLKKSIECLEDIIKIVI